MVAKARTLGQISDEILAIQVSVKKLDAEIDVFKKKKDVLVDELLKASDAQQLDKGGGKASKFTVHLHTVPSVDNWDLFYEFIGKKKWFHLLQRRPGEKACQELWEKNMVIPGVEKFTSMKVTVSEA